MAAGSEKAALTIKEDLRALGFSAVGITRAQSDDNTQQRLRDFVEAGYHGTMAWMAETLERRLSADAMWDGAKTAIVAAMNYGPDEYDPLKALDHAASGTISCYAHNRDYHDVIKGKLKQAAGRFAARTGAEVKVFIDTAPLMEKPLGQMAGLGWQGKHTNLVSRELGSWFFLGTILTDAELPLDDAEIDHCGSCRNCLDICPTKAFPAPYQIDARRCISYLTIEHDGAIPEEFRDVMGNRIYGCDDCLAVCPWNKFAKAADEIKLQAKADMISPSLARLLALDDAGFRTYFSGSPVKRIGHARFMRNCLIAAGNSGDQSLLPSISPFIGHRDAVINETAQWAKQKLLASKIK